MNYYKKISMEDELYVQQGAQMTLNKETTKQGYQTTAEEFAGNVASLAPLASIEKFAKLLPEQAHIVDIGSGSGRDAKIFTSMGIDVLGIDFCPNLIDIAKKHAPLAKFQLMDIEMMNFPECSFDGAWAACSLLHVPKSAFPIVLKKIHAFLKKDGYFYLALKKGKGETLENDLRYEGNIKKFWAFYEEDELKKHLEIAHFKILECDLVETNDPYQTHDAFRVFCQKA
jgi:SAM-dependent methyltransferase